ncbi:hypothetical protein ES319_A05G425700v1 [Gossypium barbadense]|uniref:Protein PLANT CADMIUM RESISTANCE 10 n=1 Tax=Gossypium barbadense TaxID=3634 RepID=A0A5J5W2B9_GOSBA|nr:hypothetical protein ES319_A05G425700v1 [Gossypium barbadense]
MSHRLTYPWGSRTKTFLVLLGRGMVNQGRRRRRRHRRRRRSLSLFSGLLESVLAAMTCRAVCYFDFWFVRLYRSLFPLLFVWKECRILGSGTLVGSCITHFILWALVNTLCCVLTQGFYLALPGFGCFISCYACGYRRALRSRYNLQEAPCGDFATHFFCHLCAICQEYREIRERAEDPKPPDLNLAVVTITLESSGL